jgi:hypothetical protein
VLIACAATHTHLLPRTSSSALRYMSLSAATLNPNSIAPKTTISFLVVAGNELQLLSDKASSLPRLSPRCPVHMNTDYMARIYEVGLFLERTSQNSVKRKCAEYPFHALR